MKVILTDHAIARFVERVAPGMTLDEAHAWLDAHAHDATPLPARTPRGQRQWYLPGPHGRDVVLVTKDDPGGVLAVVTVGWFEHETEPDPDDVPCPTVALVPPPAPSPRPVASGAPAKPKPAWTRPAWLPSMPADLAAPPGALRVGLDAEDQTLDLAAMTYDDMAAWLGYLNRCFSAYGAHRVTPPPLLVTARARIKAAAIVALDVIVKANRQAKAAAAAGLAPPRPRYTHDELVTALGEVMRERLGEETSAAIFTEAKIRLRADLERKVAE